MMTTGCTIKKEEMGLFYLIHVNGQFSARTIKEIKDAVEEGLNIGHIFVVFNLEKATFLDSIGTGLMLNLHKKLKEKGGSLHLINIPMALRDLLESSSVVSVIPYFANLQEAESQIG